MEHDAQARQHLSTDDLLQIHDETLFGDRADKVGVVPRLANVEEAFAKHETNCAKRWGWVMTLLVGILVALLTGLLLK